METEEELDLERIREFVRCFEGVTDLQFHAVPYDLDTDEAAGYLLLVASINQQSPAEFIRDFVLELHTDLGDDLLKFKTLPKIQREDAVKRQESWINSRGMRGWKLTPHLLRILTEASNIYCKTKSQGGLIAYGRQKGDVAIAADQLARSIHYFGKDPLGARKKVWMYLRWMVRPQPDLSLWAPSLDAKDLRIPLDVNTGRAFSDIALVPTFEKRMAREKLAFRVQSNRLDSTALNVEMITKVARWFFPEDPAKVDYAFFCYGRRFSRGDDAHRCWKFVSCDICPIRTLVGCGGRSC